MTDTTEVWLPVLGFEGIYEASNLGQVRRVGAPRALKPVVDRKGYCHVSLCKTGLCKNYAVHRIVLSAFCGAEPFEAAQAAHNDGNPGNNRLPNLRWASPSDNQKDRIRHGTHCRGEAVHNSILKESDIPIIRAMIADGLRNKPIAEHFGVSLSTIHLIRHNRIWRHVNDNRSRSAASALCGKN